MLSCFEDGVEEVVCFTVSDTISASVFRIILDFLYSGCPNLDDADLGETKRVAKLFDLSELEQICTNCDEDQDFLNPSIGTWLNDRNGSVAKQLYFNQDFMSDLAFNVEGQRIPAHCALLSARCDVLAAMLSGNFREGRGVEVSLVLGSDSVIQRQIYPSQEHNELWVLVVRKKIGFQSL